MEWRYYNDGKAWLCKVVNKKKTVFWLSIWEHYFKTSFYFTEKHLESIDALNIAYASRKRRRIAQTTTHRANDDAGPDSRRLRRLRVRRRCRREAHSAARSPAM